MYNAEIKYRKDFSIIYPVQDIRSGCVLRKTDTLYFLPGEIFWQSDHVYRTILQIPLFCLPGRSIFCGLNVRFPTTVLYNVSCVLDDEMVWQSMY